ncbi:MAG: hypothetical protein R8K50_00750 [Mariprofundus sp.]
MITVRLDKNKHLRKRFDCGIEALRKLLSASEQVAFPVIIVDAKEGVMQFYERFGFTPFDNQSSKLFITVVDVRLTMTLKR